MWLEDVGAWAAEGDDDDDDDLLLAWEDSGRREEELAQTHPVMQCFSFLPCPVHGISSNIACHPLWDHHSQKSIILVL